MQKGFVSGETSLTFVKQNLTQSFPKTVVVAFIAPLFSPNLTIQFASSFDGANITNAQMITHNPIRNTVPIAWSFSFMNGSVLNTGAIMSTETIEIAPATVVKIVMDRLCGNSFRTSRPNLNRNDPKGSRNIPTTTVDSRCQIHQRPWKASRAIAIGNRTIIRAIHPQPLPLSPDQTSPIFPPPLKTSPILGNEVILSAYLVNVPASPKTRVKAGYDPTHESWKECKTPTRPQLA